MNSTSLYVTTNQIILKSNPNNPNTWQDLYRLVPYLRNSLCCVVCGNLLVDPLTPTVGRCQHHLCRRCIGGRKKIKPACLWCKDCSDYSDNKNLRILLQCYKKMCIALVKSGIFKGLLEQAAKNQSATGVERGAGNLIVLIKEGAAFQDEYESKGGLPKSAYSILPCVYTNSSTQTLQLANVNNSKNVINSNLNKTRTSLYSVMFAGTGNKITIKRKSKETTESKPKTMQVKKHMTEKSVFKKPPAKCSTKPKRGCRCGNATLTPGKLTCCGQRCPCYVDSKPCVECKCRGCRNPHRPDGNKVRPLIPQMQQVQYQLPQNCSQPVLEQQILPNIEIENFKVGSQYTCDHHLNQQFSTYNVVGVPVATNLLLKTPILEDEEEEEEEDEEEEEEDDDSISNEDSEIIVDV